MKNHPTQKWSSHNLSAAVYAYYSDLKDWRASEFHTKKMLSWPNKEKGGKKSKEEGTIGLNAFKKEKKRTRPENTERESTNESTRVYSVAVTTHSLFATKSGEKNPTIYGFPHSEEAWHTSIYLHVCSVKTSKWDANATKPGQSFHADHRGLLQWERANTRVEKGRNISTMLTSNRWQALDGANGKKWGSS